MAKISSPYCQYCHTSREVFQCPICEVFACNDCRQIVTKVTGEQHCIHFNGKRIEARYWKMIACPKCGVDLEKEELRIAEAEIEYDSTKDKYIFSLYLDCWRCTWFKRFEVHLEEAAEYLTEFMISDPGTKQLLIRKLEEDLKEASKK